MVVQSTLYYKRTYHKADTVFKHQVKIYIEIPFYKARGGKERNIVHTIFTLLHTCITINHQKRVDCNPVKRTVSQHQSSKQKYSVLYSVINTTNYVE